MMTTTTGINRWAWAAWSVCLLTCVAACGGDSVAPKATPAAGGILAGEPTVTPNVQPSTTSVEDLLDAAQVAADAEDWTLAAAHLRDAVDTRPWDATLHLDLGTALIQARSGQEALRAFLAAERLQPQDPVIQIALGQLYELAGRENQAIERFEFAVQLDPALIAARLDLADALRRNDRPAAAVPHYGEVLAGNPAVADATFGLAVALIQLERYGEAREVLGDGFSRFDDPRFALALARLLASAPDAAVRDGLAALQLSRALLEQGLGGIEMGETMAMTMAENEIWIDAVSWQQRTIEAVRAGGADQAYLDRLGTGLSRYQREQPVREPWPPDHEIFHPGPPVDPTILPAS